MLKILSPVLAVATAAMFATSARAQSPEAAPSPYSAKPAIPESAFFAGYIDYRVLLNGLDGALRTVYDKTPAIFKPYVNEVDMEIKDFKAILADKQLPVENFEWGFFAIMADPGIATASLDDKPEHINHGGAVICMKDTAPFVKMLAGKTDLDNDVRTVAGAEVFVYSGWFFAPVDSHIIVISPGEYSRWDSENNKAVYEPDEFALKALIRSQRGYGGSSRRFARLAEVSGDTFARFMIPSPGKNVDRAGLRQLFNEHVARTGDPELSDSLLNLGDFVVDFRLNGESAGVIASLEMASDADADQMAGFLSSSSLLYRVGLDSGMVAISYNMDDIKRDMQRSNFPPALIANTWEICKALRTELSDAVVTGRDGRTVWVSATLNFARLMDAVLKVLESNP